MDLDKAIKVANAVVLRQAGRPLRDVERHLLEAALAGQSYEQMADGWSSRTLKDTGSRLWGYFSEALGNHVKVSKSNFLAALIQLSQDPCYQDGLPQGTPMTGSNRSASQPNPFSDRGRITDSDRFFDREEILRRAFECLEQGCSLSIVGESQVGKSSLLAMICEQGPERLPSHTFVLLDMQCIRDENDFFTALCQELKIDPPCRGFALNRKLKNSRYVLCLDEIERMVNLDDFSGRERTELRGLAEGRNAPLTLVIASRSCLSDLFPGSPEKTSPLAGICQQLTISGFSAQVAQNFIENRLRGTQVSFTSAQIRQLIEKSEGHPAQLQQFSALLYRKIQ
ncbi:MAG: hypothetical protein ABG776_16285, partial [Cyanobacteria bacterium J06555_13]